ncbi:hypothetical protein AVEN_22376-1 [Araneus ventricosus]|uniref:Uncharacterized protein n=1 Tax=Araneus ventricosus TaxID=182803 RepID=A0A4Y2RHD5_ARAVE|nr:hypothetical protein AVEN_22376-1 [Araneus ventricosus]
MFFDRYNLTRIIGNFYLNQIYTGHGVFGEYQSRCFQKTATCRCDEEIETVEHLVKKCKPWSRFRVNWPKNWPNLNTVELMQILPCRRDAVRMVEQQLTFRIEELDTVWRLLRKEEIGDFFLYSLCHFTNDDVCSEHRSFFYCVFGEEMDRLSLVSCGLGQVGAISAWATGSSL